MSAKGYHTEINSHIQMPRVLLKRFHNDNNRFFYYDVEKQIIGNNGTAKSTNTEVGYYSKQTEDYFRDNIETPFGNLLTYIEKNNIYGDIFSISINAEQIVKNFICALVARGPNFRQQMNSEKEFWQSFPLQFQHDYIAKAGLEIAIENDIFSDYIVTYMINNTSTPFVLSMDGIYNYLLNGHQVINLPILPFVTASLIHKDYSARVVKTDGSLSMFEISRPGDIMLMNDCAFSSQIKRNWGYVVCHEEDELIRLKHKFVDSRS